MSHPDLIISARGIPKRAGDPRLTLGKEVLQAIKDPRIELGTEEAYIYIATIAITTARALDLIE